MKFLARIIPAWQNVLLAILAAVLLVLAFPDFEFWFLAWFALVPLMWAVEREKASVVSSFLLGWIFGTAFFFGTCWWLTYAPIHYASVPWPIAYFLIFIACLGAGIFPGIFATILSVLLRRFGSWAFLAAPFVWVFSEFLRYWLTGNNWNAIGYSQALVEIWTVWILRTASVGGVLFTSGAIVLVNGLAARALAEFQTAGAVVTKLKRWLVISVVFSLVSMGALGTHLYVSSRDGDEGGAWQTAIAVQPNVPMAGLDQARLKGLRDRHVELAQEEIARLAIQNEKPTLVILPESPMNFMYNDDREFQQFIGNFARSNNVSVLFNSAEPDATNGKYFNSAVMVGPEGKEVAQYDKIYLLPFGEAVPRFLDGIVPGFVGNFSYGGEYDLLPIGDTTAGVMICFESHFGQLSREYVRHGADVIIEMTNDGYLGPTPVLKQHLANAVFRAVESDRPLLRVTNVGVTARINQYGDMCDSMASCGPEPYTEGTVSWSYRKSDGSQTFYVKYGDWFAWLCSLVTIGLLIFSGRRRMPTPPSDLLSPTATDI